MASPLTLGALALAVLAVNVPFGWWRAGTRKLSLPWFVAVHAPVPLTVGLRLLAGVRWRLETIPVLLLAYGAGQLVGGRLRARRARPG